MLRSFIIHLVICLVWVLLMQELTIGQFAIGALLGYLFLLLFPTLLKSKDYVRRVRAAVYFLFHFLWVFCKANYVVAKQVLLYRRKDIVGKFIEVPIDNLTWFETIAFAHFITLTPGTTSVWIAKEPKHLVVHALSKKPDDAIAQELIEELLLPIQRFTR